MPRRRRKRLPKSIRLPRRVPREVALLLLIIVAVSILWRDRQAATSPPARVAVAPSIDTDFARYHDRSFRVVNVVDGDTIDIDVPDGDARHTRIRLWGVDTPELAHFGKPTMHFGPEAAAFARATLEGRTVHVVLSPIDTRGNFGRLLAYVFLERGGVMFNEMLIERGYAYADPRFDHHYKRQFRDAEKRARRAGMGLWAEVTVDQMPNWRQRVER